MSEPSTKKTYTEPPFPKESESGWLNPIFEEYPLGKFQKPASGGVICVDVDTTIANACATLSTNNILCAPVRDPSKPASAGWSERYVGIVDFLGIVHWMVEKLGGELPDRFEQLVSLHDSFATTKVSELSTSTRWGRFIPVDEDSNSFLDVMLILGKYMVHRVCVVKAGADLSNIITQSAVVEALKHSTGDFRALEWRSLHDLGMDGEREVVSVREDQTLFEAFKLIATRNVSALPVVDADGRLVGTLSARDVRFVLLNSEKYVFLRLPINKFPDLTRRVETCAPQDSLRTVINKLVATKIHRVYLLDPSGRPDRVIALSDVIARFVKEPSDDYFGRFFS